MEQFEHFLAAHPWVYTLAQKGIRILVIIAGVVLSAKLIHAVSLKILSEARAAKIANADVREREKRLATVVKIVDTSLRVVLFGAAVMMVLREVGLDITPLLTGAGIAGVAVGFGAQSLVKDMISGFFLLIEDQIRIGDVIQINAGLSGTVERMELRVTAIRDGDGALHIVPNGEIKSVSNRTYEFAMAVVDVPLPYATDLQKAQKLILEVIADFEQDQRFKSALYGRIDFAGVTRFEPNYMVLSLSVKTEPHSRVKVANELRARVKQLFSSNSIEFVYFRT